MASDTQTLATADAILKDLYVGPIIEQLNYKTWMLDKIKRDSESVPFGGRRWIHPVHSRRNRRRGAMSDGGTLVEPGREGYTDAIDTVRYLDTGVEITDAAMKQATGNNEGAFINLLNDQTEGAAKAMKKDVNRQIYGSGDALLATVTGGATSATIAVDTTQYLEVGDPVDILTRATGAAVGGGTGLEVLDTATSGLTVTLSGSVTVTTAEGVYLAGSRNLEMPGLRLMGSTGRTLHGINSATAGNKYWDAKVRAAGGTAGESLFEQIADDVGKGGNGEVDAFLTTRGIRRRLADTYTSLKRYNDAKAVEIHGGYTAIFVNEIPVVSDDDAPKGFAFGIGNKAFKWFEVDGPDWLKSQDGNVWELADASTAGRKRAAWQAWFIWYASLGCLAPNQIGVITGATDDVI